MPQDLTTGQLATVSMVRALSATALTAISFTKRRGHVEKKQAAYGGHAQEHLDHLVPPGTPHADAVVFFHGGGWVAGNKRYYTKDLAFLAEAGYAVFNVDYPLAPEYPHPHALHSMLRAVEWIHEQHPEIEALHMMGDSAGGNMAAMYAVMTENPELLTQLAPGVSAHALLPARSVISLYGMLDRETALGENPDEASPMIRLFLQSYGGPDTLRLEPLPAERAVTPMDLSWSNHPRCFIGVGDKDFLLPSSARYARHLEALGVPVVEKIYPDATHGFLNLRHEQTPVLKRDVLDFIQAV